MFKFWKKKTQGQSQPESKNKPQQSDNSQKTIKWDDRARQALTQAASQAPVPGMMKKRVESELKKAAEESARKAGRDTVTPEDLMQGLLGKLPKNMREKIENAAKEGPEGLKRLEKEMRGKK